MTTEKESKSLEPLCMLYFEHLGIRATFTADSKEASKRFKREAREKDRSIPQHMCESILFAAMMGGCGKFEEEIINN
jgi:hypothetical protein